MLSLEEILAEGANGNTCDRERRGAGGRAGSGSAEDSATARGSGGGGTSSPSDASSQVVKLTKQQIKTLQEAMYHSAESGHLGKSYTNIQTHR